MVVALVTTREPLHLRWELSKPAFAATVTDVGLAGQGGVEPGRRSRIGLFRVTNVVPVSGGILFYEANGSLFDDAGFAYLPAGPDPGLENGSFESQVFRHLGGPWYTFTAGS